MRKWIFVLSLILTFNAFAQTVTSGNCGPMDSNGAYTSSCTWNYDAATHTLSFTGDGYMSDFGASQDTDGRYRTHAPWRDLDTEIEHVEVGGNLKSIGGCSVYSFPNIQDINITAPIESFGQEVFGEVKDFEIPSTVKSIGEMGLAYTDTNTIIIPDSVETIGDYGFEFAQATSIILGKGIQKIGSNAFLGTSDSLTIFCEDTSQNRCSDLIGSKNSDYVDKIKRFTKDAQTGFYQTEDGKLFANVDLMMAGAACDDAANCQDILDAVAAGEPFFVGGQRYASLDTFIKGEPEPSSVTQSETSGIFTAERGKRIYTVKEANEAAGKKNKLMIRYK